MSIEQVRRFVLFVVLLLVQGLVLNHIHLFDCATPLIYIILVLHFRRNQSRWSALLWSFSLGLCVDVFANTPGVAAASMTLMGLVQPYLFELFIPRDSADDLEPTIRSIGVSSFLVCFHHDSALLLGILHIGNLQFLQLDPVAQVYRGQYPAHLLAGYGIGKY